MGFSGRIGAVGALGIAGILIVGCGPTVIDQVKLEDTVQQNLEKGESKAIRAVECPSDQEVAPGATFTCTVEYSDGGKSIATLRIRNERADLSLIDLKTNK